MAYGRQPARGIGIKITVVCLALILVIVGALSLSGVLDRGWDIFSGNDSTMPAERVYNGQTYRLKSHIETMLVLGLDTYAATDTDAAGNAQQADILLLLVMDTAADTCQTIHLHRDTVAQMHVLGMAGETVDTVSRPLALAHTYGNGRETSCRNTANAVADLLGVDVDHYVSLTMDAVQTYNDLVGGVTLEVLEDLSSADAALVPGQTVTLSGSQALTYIRTRSGAQSAAGDLWMQRQQQYLQALFRQSRQKAAEDAKFMPRVALKLADQLVSDCSGLKLEKILSASLGSGLETIHTPDGTWRGDGASAGLYLDTASVDEMVIRCFYEPVV